VRRRARRRAVAFRRNRPTFIEYGLSLTLAGSIQLVSPCFLVPRVEIGSSKVPPMVVTTVGGTATAFGTTPESLLSGLVAAVVVVMVAESLPPVLIDSRGHRGLESTGNSAFHQVALLVE
jgi:hypothetical protein